MIVITLVTPKQELEHEIGIVMGIKRNPQCVQVNVIPVT